MRIVQCHGCFDLLHVGHLRHFEAAKQLGDRLIVTVTPDEFVNKGPGRPVFPLAQRMEAIRAVRWVDEVRSSESSSAVWSIFEIRPAVFAKGPDYTVETMDPEEVRAVQNVGGVVAFTQTEKWSSTALLHRATHSPEVERYLACLRQKYSASDVLGWLEKARALSVLVIGEAIIDVYQYCNVIGKAGKEPILAAQLLPRCDEFQGGVHAVAGHVRAVSDQVTCLTGPPIIKRRFIESYPFQKLFETYEMDEAAQAQAGDLLPVSEADLTIVADYGHGLVTPRLMRSLAGGRVALNVQANAGNHGYHTLSKYKRADFISLSERELRLDARDQVTDVRTLMRRAAGPRGATLLITRGEKGCLAYDAQAGFHEGMVEAPALASHTIDRMGAGDAVFGVTACLAAVDAPLDVIAFVAAVVGTMAVGIVGNARYIERDALQQAIQAWLA